MTLLQVERLAPYEPCHFRSDDTMKQTLKMVEIRNNLCFTYSLEEGLLNLQFHLSLHKKNNLILLLFLSVVTMCPVEKEMPQRHAVIEI